MTDDEDGLPGWLGALLLVLLLLGAILRHRAKQREDEF